MNKTTIKLDEGILLSILNEGLIALCKAAGIILYRNADGETHTMNGTKLVFSTQGDQYEVSIHYVSGNESEVAQLTQAFDQL